MSDCEHSKRFQSVFFLPKEDHGCLACALERVSAENECLEMLDTEGLAHLQEENRVRSVAIEGQEKLIKFLTERVQYLVDHWPVPLEDGGITFPDGEFWKTSS